MKRRITLLNIFGCISILFLLSCSGKTEKTKNELISSLEKNIITIDNIEKLPNKGLVNAISNNSVLALGESTHGAREFYLIKNQLIKSLIKKQEFKIVAIEVGFSQGLLINKYLHTGEGNLKKLVQDLQFYMYNTEEFIDLLKILREYNENQSQKNKISFYGFDMQDRKFPVKNIINFLEKVDVNYLNQKEKKLVNVSKSGHKPNEDNMGFLDEIEQYFVKNKQSYVKESSEQEFELVLKQFDILKQAEEYYNNYMSDEIRDKYMAENILWLMKYHKYKSKMIVWAHNAHISKEKSSSGFMNIFEWNNMGYYLNNSKDISYYALAFEFSKGTILAGSKERRLNVFKIEHNKEFSFSNILEKLNSNIFFINFDNDSILPTSLKNWLDSELTWHSIGGIYDPEDVKKLTITAKTHYNGVIYVKKVSSLNLTK